MSRYGGINLSKEVFIDNIRQKTNPRDLDAIAYLYRSWFNIRTDFIRSIIVETIATNVK